MAQRTIDVRACLADPVLEGMNTLNEVVLRYPAAISFGPGRPLEELFGVKEHVEGLDAYIALEAERSGASQHAIWQSLGQYGRTNGVINELIAVHLARDHDIHVEPAAIMMTVGAQEAMAVALAGLIEPATEVLLASDPAYVGITGISKVLGVANVPVPAGDAGLEPAVVEQAICDAGRYSCVRALYDVPDFNNPLGTSMPVDARRGLLDVCRRHGVFLIEDNPYGLFAYDGDPMPPLKSMDRDGTVIYVGSFAKTLFPGLRVGYLVADQRVSSSGETLAQALSRVKSMFTVNTSPLMQAVVGGALLRAGGALKPILEPKRLRYRANRDVMMAALTDAFGQGSDVSWRVPAGGFFVTLTLPVEFGPEELRFCAERSGVIVCPMSLFSNAPTRRRQIRLSFSYAQHDEIREGVYRLSEFVGTISRAKAATDGVHG